MNANTALLINDAVAQAVLCGESLTDIRNQVERAISQAVIVKAEAEIAKAQATIKFHRRTLEGIGA